jgi:hypothetical protein
MKTIKFLFSDLNQDERQFIGGAAIMVAGLAFLFWLTTTVSKPMVDQPTIDSQVHVKPSYELPASFNKYVNRIYNEKYGK